MCETLPFWTSVVGTTVTKAKLLYYKFRHSQAEPAIQRSDVQNHNNSRSYVWTPLANTRSRLQPRKIQIGQASARLGHAKATPVIWNIKQDHKRTSRRLLEEKIHEELGVVKMPTCTMDSKVYLEPTRIWLRYRCLYKFASWIHKDWAAKPWGKRLSSELILVPWFFDSKRISC